MVHFPGFARTHLCIQWAVVRVYRTGFPHSEIPGSSPACGFPRLIAACHVLHRLLLPRHSPCALSSLTIKFTQHTRLTADHFSDLMSFSTPSSHIPQDHSSRSPRGVCGRHTPGSSKVLIKNSYSPCLYLPNAIQLSNIDHARYEHRILWMRFGSKLQSKVRRPTTLSQKP